MNSSGLIRKDDEVVDDATARVEHQAVARLSVGQVAHAAGDQALQQRGGAGTAHEKLAHVAGIEEAGLGAGVEVLLDNAAVLHGHAPPRKGDHACSERLVAGGQRGFF